MRRLIVAPIALTCWAAASSAPAIVAAEPETISLWDGRAPWVGALAGQQNVPRNQALYVTMRDGVKIAIDIWLPADLDPDQEIPTVLRATRYWRATDTATGEPEDDRNFDEAELFNGNGYALVVVDARGSGASFGTRPYELSQEEVRDYGEVVDWIIEQPWSNGRVGAWGVSYSGNTAEMLAVSGHPAVKAIAPLFNDFDNFGHLVFPNSLLTVGFLQDWGEAVHDMDLNDICALRDVAGDACAELRQQTSGVKPVDSDQDRQRRSRPPSRSPA
ncbi:MAG TPA: CocE/NonD family hydrolase [Acidobacteriota bacterium]|nr:CocE/NonD family hydrolase [Acidobacteriota bacterium]